ncbi:tail fiber protein [Rhizobium phage RHph_TM30]|uniref:Putative phage tail fiber protein n=1 Tax=Rhizobium phage RHph_TM30 TaxID=2509764 RepID=A0A7S5R5G7_9CAUD|nr:tail fiber protein [Rhizobium phage RHph_TM30]QIG71435.1 putative phage tail fiber protein [Rhizobium phage RHph_TM30]QIG72522.1 putative phage tail fiber protein [Rhizobium phage RHph_TM3_3_6]
MTSKNTLLAGRASIPISDPSRNKIINGDFRIWQRATSQTTADYGSDDRWANTHVGSTKTHSQQPFTVGQTEVPGEPIYFSRTVVTSVAGAGNYVLKHQKIENVRTLVGKRATITFYAKADSAKNIAVDLVQVFGTGGSPSSNVDFAPKKVLLSTSWQKFSYTVNIPSISGKTLGSNPDNYLGLRFWFDAGSNWNANTVSLGQQSGTFDIARVSLVEGDATSESDPFYERPLITETLLCYRYYIKYPVTVGNSGNYTVHITPTPMRTVPSISWIGTAANGNTQVFATGMYFTHSVTNTFAFSLDAEL